jgi:rhodanese-related sulfurtransferase
VLSTAKRIDPLELEGLVDRGAVTILDMRRNWDESPAKIPGAIRVHPDAYREFATKLPREKDVVTYCT